MSYLNAQFDELYRRHLCRHGHFGINVLHLTAVIGIYLGLVGLVDRIIRLITTADPVPILFSLAACWLILIIRNLPLSIALSTCAVVAAIITAVQVLRPFVPWPLWALLIPAMHHLQQWSHSVYRMHRDMSEFNGVYRKGFKLFVILLMYELPILLNYFLFGASDWVMGRSEMMEEQQKSPAP